jgi:exopolyphosphatase/guanosine-5'-triphosphate,3'-diphosphate pyrophosphatase
MPPTPSTLAALDIGTNSFHLIVARAGNGTGFEVIATQKDVVRLGHGGGDMKELSRDAIDRGIAALGRMRRIADSYGAPLRAVATSAVREASNAGEFITRAHRVGVEVEVISGVEEARLIHLGVLQAVPVYDKRVFLTDIGGGSTELLVGKEGETLAARSMKLGAVRLSDRFFPGEALHPSAVSSCRQHVRSALAVFEHEVEQIGFDVAVASSGTAEAIARIVQASVRAPATGRDAATPPRTFNCFEFTHDEVTEVVRRLARAATISARRAIPGMDPSRADIIMAGALILEGVGTAFGVGTWTFSDYALREGVLLDTVARTAGAGGAQHQLRDVARQSVRRLADRCDDNPEHSAHVARLAIELFDATRSLHGLGDPQRDYLEAAALLANVGLVISHSKHHLHSYHVIRNSELVGFTDPEIELIAQVARYHRKSGPKPSHPTFAALTPEHQRVVQTLSGVLRVAIGLDRSQEGRVAHVSVTRRGQRVTVHATPAGRADIDLELYAANERAQLMSTTLDRDVRVVAP